MGRKSRHKVGYDVAAAIRLLHEALRDAGVVERDSDAAKDPLRTAMVHAFAHGIQTSGLCDARPCRVGVMSFALYEIVLYERERTGSPLVPAAEAAEQLASVLRTEFTRFGPSMLQPFLRARAQHDLEAKHLKAVMHPRELVCEGPGWLSSTMLHRIVGLEGFGKAARNRLESSELQQSRSSKRSKLLLNSVYQNRRSGSLSPKSRRLYLTASVSTALPSA